MKKNKKKKSKKKNIKIKENIILHESFSYNSLSLDNIDFHSRSMLMSRAALELYIDEIKNSLDNMNELNETESLRLQMAMDRLSKFVEALSNIMKKIDSTQETIVQNLKG